MESVSGGGHWGGGVWASTRDHARFGTCSCVRGEWKRQRPPLGAGSRSPQHLRRPPDYGFLWWRQPNGTLPGGPPRSVFALGPAGTSSGSPEHDMVVVLRWTDNARVNEILRGCSPRSPGRMAFQPARRGRAGLPSRPDLRLLRRRRQRRDHPRRQPPRLRRAGDPLPRPGGREPARDGDDPVRPPGGRADRRGPDGVPAAGAPRRRARCGARRGRNRRGDDREHLRTVSLGRSAPRPPARSGSSSTCTRTAASPGELLARWRPRVMTPWS